METGPQTTIQLDPTIENSVSAAENTDKISLTIKDSNFIESEGNAEGMIVESLAGMLDDDLYNDETLPRLSELDVAI